METKAGNCRYLLEDGTQCQNPAQGAEHLCELHRTRFLSDREVYEAVTAHFRQDLSLFWTRANFYLIVQAGLFSVMITIFTGSSWSSKKLAILSICLLGFVLTIFWFLVMRGAIFWISKWREQIIKIDKAVNRFQSYAKIETSLISSPFLSPSIITKYLPLVFIAVWIIGGILAILTL